MTKNYLITFCCLVLCGQAFAQSFTSGNLVVLQTTGAVSKASSAITLKEITPSGAAGITVNVPSNGITPIQTSGVYGGSEGFLTTSDDGKFLVLGGYATAGTFSDITGTTSASVPRVVGLVYPSGYYLQIDTSTGFYNGNDIRGAISDGTNFWASGAANANIDGIDYFGPGTHAALAVGATPPKAYGIRIFNSQVYYSTQKSGPNNTSSQLGIFALGTGLPTSGTVTVSQVINTGSIVPEDFSFNPAGNICYVAINLNNATGGIQKWTKSGSVWSLAYTLGTGATNIGAYGIVVDYSGSNPVIYATTFESAGNRVIKITDAGSGSAAATLVAAASGVFYKGITFAPVSSGLPLVNLSVSADTASEAGLSVITVAANTSAPVSGNQTVNIAVSGPGITSGDYSLSGNVITIVNGATSGSVTFTVKDDILGEGTEVAQVTMSSPSSGIVLGMKKIQTVTIEDNDGNNKPVISVNTDSTTNLIDGGVVAAPTPFQVSGVVADPTDPAKSIGIRFLVSDLETPANLLTYNITSSNTAIVPLSNINFTGTDTDRLLNIDPVDVGHTDIRITVNDGTDSASYVINYAASATSYTPNATIWHTGMSDGSDAIALDDDYFISGDDELNILNVYSRKLSGMPAASFPYTSFLALPEPAKPEVDLEAAAQSLKNPGRMYWLGSMSNGKSPFDNKPNRDRIFAANVTGTAANTSFTFAGYAALRSGLLSWGDAAGYDFTNSAAAGVDAKQLNGFAAEGMVFGPDSTTLYIGLRAPLVPTTNRKNAVIAPVTNFEAWFNNGAPSGNPAFGSPIELDLGGRGIRDMARLTNGTYIIIAGNPEGTPVKGAIYKWTGNAADTPILVSSPATDTLNMEGVMQVNSNGNISLAELQVITDKGSDILYNDGVEAKDFNDLVYRKFRSDRLTSLNLVMPVGVPDVYTSANSMNIYPNPAHGWTSLLFTSNAAESYTLRFTDLAGRVLSEIKGTSQTGANSVKINTSLLPAGMYIIHMASASVNYSTKLMVE